MELTIQDHELLVHLFHIYIEYYCYKLHVVLFSWHAPSFLKLLLCGYAFMNVCVFVCMCVCACACVVRSFHSNMISQIRLDGELLEGIGVNSGLRQGCTIAPKLFNLYSCGVAERWLSRVGHVEGVGTTVLYKLDQRLFRRSTSGAGKVECQFADDVALLATSRAGAEGAIGAYHSAAAAFGLTVSYSKTKFLVAGHGVTEEDMLPIMTPGGSIECVSVFAYLGSQISSDGQLDVEVEKRIAAALRAFGAFVMQFFVTALCPSPQRDLCTKHVF